MNISLKNFLSYLIYLRTPCTAIRRVKFYDRRFCPRKRLQISDFFFFLKDYYSEDENWRANYSDYTVRRLENVSATVSLLFRERYTILTCRRQLQDNYFDNSVSCLPRTIPSASGTHFLFFFFFFDYNVCIYNMSRGHDPLKNRLKYISLLFLSSSPFYWYGLRRFT